MDEVRRSGRSHDRNVSTNMTADAGLHRSTAKPKRKGRRENLDHETRNIFVTSIRIGCPFSGVRLPACWCIVPSL